MSKKAPTYLLFVALAVFLVFLIHVKSMQKNLEENLMQPAASAAQPAAQDSVRSDLNTVPGKPAPPPKDGEGFKDDRIYLM